MFYSKTQSILATLDDIGANIFFRLPLYLSRRKTAYVVDDIGIWLFCKPIGYVESFVRSGTKRFRRKRRGRNKISRKNVEQLRSVSWLGRGNCVGDRQDSHTYGSELSSVVTHGLVEEQDQVGLRSLVLSEHDGRRMKEDIEQDADTRTVSSNSWSKWSESVTNGSTWLTSVSSVWGYALGSGTGGQRRRRRKRSVCSRKTRRVKWGWKRWVWILQSSDRCADIMYSRLASIWAKLDAYYDWAGAILQSTDSLRPRLRRRRKASTWKLLWSTYGSDCVRKHTSILFIVIDHNSNSPILVDVVGMDSRGKSKASLEIL